ncbi:hypothetical protein Tco_1270322, partial [Tanacetum coccineum]
PVAPPSPDYIPGPEDPQTPPVAQDEDERKAMFIQPHDPDYVPEPIYPEYIPLEDEHEFLAEEQPLPPVVSPTAESPGYVNESDPEEDPVEDDADDKDEDEGDEDDEDEEEDEHLALANSAIVVPTVELVSLPEGTEPVIPPSSTDITTIGARERLARCTAPPVLSSPPPVPSPLLPSFGCPTQIQTLRIASTQTLIDAVTTALPSPPLPPSLYIPPAVNHRDDIPESEQPPRKRDTWVDPAEAVPEIAPMTVGEVNTRVTELAELHEHDTQDLYALLEDAQDSRSRISQRAYASREAWAHSIGLSQVTHQELQTHRDHVYAHETHLQAHQTQLQLQGTLIQTQHQVHETRFQMQQAEIAALRETDRRRQAQMVETLRVMRDMRREMGDMQTELLALRGQRRARQPAPDARIPDHQDALGDADSHV